nr:glucokinase [Burkholderia stabilis]
MNGCDAYSGMIDAMRVYLRDAGGVRVRHAAIAIASPVGGVTLSMTNHAGVFRSKWRADRSIGRSSAA